MPLPTPTMRRLAIVKYLHTQALEQERKGGPLAGLALLPFHDAVELFLQVAAETHSLTMTSQQRTEFMAYWHAFSKASLPLPYEPQMRHFNDARVAVKHKGLLPIQQQIEEFRSVVTAFLTDATPKVFQTEFDSISLSSLVRSDDVRSSLQAAETATEAGQFGEALEQAAKAFHLSLRNYRWFETPRLFDPTDTARDLWQRGQSLSDWRRALGRWPCRKGGLSSRPLSPSVCPRPREAKARQRSAEPDANVTPPIRSRLGRKPYGH